MISIIIPKFLQMECASSSRYPYMEEFNPLDATLKSIKAQPVKHEVIFAPWSDKGGFDARNRATAKAKGDIILFLCPEAVLLTDRELQNLEAVFAETKADVVVGSSYSDFTMPLFQRVITLEYEERERSMPEGWVQAGATSYMAIRRNVFEAVGGFPLISPCVNEHDWHDPITSLDDWAFQSSFHDWDFCSLLIEKGYHIWHTHRFKVIHCYQTGLVGLLKKQYQHAKYRVRFQRRFRKLTVEYDAKAFIPPVWTIYKRHKDVRAFLIIPLALARYVAWVAGFIAGFLNV